MTAQPSPAALLPWALALLGLPEGQASPAMTMVAGDASPRRYFRLDVPGGSYIAVESPPATQKNAEFVALATLLRDAGVRVPQILGADLERGFLLLEDLGDRTLLPALDAGTVAAHYRKAFAILLQMAAASASGSVLQPYDRALLDEELHRFDRWFLQELLGYTLAQDEQQLLQQFYERLIDSALQQPQVVVHRDFHSRNLMLVAAGELAVIDFQDAVIGPVTYDLVSLLRDCYVQWPPAQVQRWAVDYFELLQSQGVLAGVTQEQFVRWFDWMGLQRHIKVLGTFARLFLRDGKSAYLADLPLVIHYVREITEKYAADEPVFAGFGRWFEQRLAPLIAQQDWSKAP